jgi:hypothetical protein
MLLMYSRPPGHSFLPIKLVSVVDGAPLRSIRVRLHSNEKVDFLELCNDRLLIKQKHHALQVLNVFDGAVTSVPASVFKSPEVGRSACTCSLFFMFSLFCFGIAFVIISPLPLFLSSPSYLYLCFVIL